MEVHDQFIRQALALPNRPIVVFSHSATENWRANSCSEPVRPHVLTDDEKQLLKSLNHHRPIEVFTSINSIEKHFSVVKRLDSKYKVLVMSPATLTSVQGSGDTGLLASGPHGVQVPGTVHP